MRAVLKPHIDIPWSKDSVKEFLWRPVQELQFHKKSTTQLTTTDLDDVYNTLNRFLGEKFGVHEPWPSMDELAQKSAEAIENYGRKN